MRVRKASGTALSKLESRRTLRAQAMLEAILGAIKFPMAKAGEFDRTAHVARICYRRRELVDAFVPARHERGGDQRHATADEVYQNRVQAASTSVVGS